MSDETWEVLLPATIHPAGPNSISDFVTFRTRDEYETIEELVRDAPRFDAIIIRVSELPGDVIDAATNLKVIAKHGVGVDNIDIEAATANDVVVCNTPGANTRAVAEHTLTLLLALNKQLVQVDSHVREGGWNDGQFTNREVEGTVLGLFGFGAIARIVAAKADGIGMECIAYDPYVDAEDTPDYVDLVPTKAALFDEADHVSVHAPLTDKTHHAISTAELEALPNDGVVVNTSRGELVDEGALVRALDAGTIGGAGLDVFEEEPPAEDNPLLEHDRTILSPHLAAVTEEAMERMSVQASANVQAVYNGTLPESTLNRDGLESPSTVR
ncbi:hydroxyacid dehydrogenase [Halobacteria archaeon AArc-curdl1]|uniref:Hydroxyacid dehydrogenase n=1 Tax=Natronosalvus hydrolyticus TaxID=2979988 RepID=A0AAP2Z6D3_9EURY|nr:hydroxyacid dehydrogenase [Halobacteria archaeon AArc-curdl1]